MTWDSVKSIINENDTKMSLAAIEILVKYCNNIISHPAEQKYRRIRLKNPIVESKLMPVVGALECLFDMGFLEDGEYLSMPQNCSLSLLKVIRDELLKEKDNLMNNKSSEPVPLVPAPVTQPLTSRMTPQVARDMMISEARFYSKLNTSSQHVLLYEDTTLQGKARNIIPLKELENEARQRLASLQSDDGNIDFSDCLLLSLLNWFKTSFFSWVDAPNCDVCSGPTTMIGMTEPTPEELRWSSGRVEAYRCNVCGAITRFPRYNYPGKLLETRRGRCGEWANCFTLCCRAVGFEARYVLDWTDHVWTEVYSQSQKRWLHCDPCENVCDKPLLYEAGWGKKLTYIIAFSKDDIMDVTWRYSSKHSELRSRRKECRELWLVNLVCKMNKLKREGMTPARRETMLRRTVIELIEFLTIKSADSSQLSGRTTGSLAWRMARGELGSGSNTSEYVFKLSEKEIEKKELHVKYNCAKDEYRRLIGNEITKGWASRTNQVSDIFRKEEKDWKMVYLARTEGSSSASISWKFDFTDSDLRITRLYIKACTAVYESGIIKWRICGDEQCLTLQGNDLQNLTSVDLQGSSRLSITANLSKGNGSVAWQHTQLFRQSSNEFSDFPFEIKILFK